MTCHAWPGAPLRWRPRMARRRRAWLTGSRRPGCRPVLQGNRPAPASNPPALAGNTPVLAGNTPAPGNGQHSRQPSSTRGNQACFVRYGARVRYLHFLACAQAGLGLPRSRGSRRAAPAIAAHAIANTGAEPDGGSGRTQDAGIPPARTPEGGRQGWGEGVICRKPALHHSDPAMAADRQPPPFWANHSSTRQAMSEPRTAPAFQLTWQ